MVGNNLKVLLHVGHNCFENDETIVVAKQHSKTKNTNLKLVGRFLLFGDCPKQMYFSAEDECIKY